MTSFERGTTTKTLRFPGQYHDPETGLNQNWHRDYDARLGRYLEPDPIGQAGGLNVYPHVNNQPINNTDPNGLIGAEGVLAGEIVFGGAGCEAVIGAVTSAGGAAAVVGAGTLSYSATSRLIEDTWLDGGLGEWLYDKLNGDEEPYPLPIPRSKAESCSDNNDGDDDYCYKRWLIESYDCQKWEFMAGWAVGGCLERAAARRDLCKRNGGKPHPKEPDEWSMNDLF